MAFIKDNVFAYVYFSMFTVLFNLKSYMCPSHIKADKFYFLTLYCPFWTKYFSLRKRPKLLSFKPFRVLVRRTSFGDSFWRRAVWEIGFFSIIAHYTDVRSDRSLCLEDHYPITRILGLLPDRQLSTDICSPSHL